MSHVLRLGLAAMMIMAILVLGLVIDTAFYAVLAETAEGIEGGPFDILTHLEGVAQIVVPMMLLGVVLWVIWGSIQEERREEQVRRVRR